MAMLAGGRMGDRPSFKDSKKVWSSESILVEWPRKLLHYYYRPHCSALLLPVVVALRLFLLVLRQRSAPRHRLLLQLIAPEPVSLCRNWSSKQNQGVECRIGSFLLLFLVVADLCRLPIGLSVPQSTHISRAPLCMSPRRNWDSPNPSPASECSLALRTKRVGGGTLACG
jgi:hypothetical protein